MIAIEPHPVTHARLAFNRTASGFRQIILVAAAVGPSDGELMIETDGDNLGASHIVTGKISGNAIKVPSLRLQRIDDANVSHVDALKIDVEGYEDRVLTGFFKEALPSLWPRGGDRASVPERMVRGLHCRHAHARLRRDRQDPQQHSARSRFRLVRVVARNIAACAVDAADTSGNSEMPIDPQEDPPIRPGQPSGPPREAPPGNPRPRCPPMQDPGEPPTPEELPAYTPDELPVQAPKDRVRLQPRPMPVWPACGIEPDLNLGAPGIPQGTM